MAKTQVFFFLLALGTTSALRYSECEPGGSEKYVAKLQDIQVSDCEGETCNFIKGKTVTMMAKLKSNREITDATLDVYAYLGGLKIPANNVLQINGNSCNDFKPSCPIQTNTDFVYTSSVNVDPNYPSIQVVVEWHLKDQANATIMCVDVPVAILA